MISRLPRPRHVIAGLCTLLLGPSLFAQRAVSDSSLLELSLEQLLNVEVRSVSKKEERLFAAPAAVFVLTASDLRRTGVANIQEALQLVPGLHVAQTMSSQYAVGSRGFSGQYTNKLLVLVDGRSIYSRIFGGVVWEEEDLPISEIDHIEVIRGPGASIWGANAVNGVINIVTKDASATDGSALSARAGRLGRQEYNVHHSGGIGSDWQYRVFADRKSGDALRTATGADASDDWRIMRGGVRTMYKRGTQSLTLSADAHQLKYGTIVPTATASPIAPLQVRERSDFRGGHGLARWERTDADGGRLTVQSYLAQYDRLGDQSIDGLERTFDLEVQRQQTLGSRQRLVWGGGFRTVSERNRGLGALTFNPERLREQFWNAFAQNEIEIRPKKAFLTLGAKLERNPYSGWEFQPKVSASVLPSDRQTFWVSASRAVRIPSAQELSLTYPQVVLPAQGPQPPTMITLVGNPSLGVETLIAWEGGYRVRPVSAVSIDLSVYRNHYPNVRLFEQRTPTFVPTATGGQVLIEAAAQNSGIADITGAELLVRWEPTRGWVLEGASSLLHWESTVTDAALPQSIDREGAWPERQHRLRSSASLPGNLDLDLTYRYTAALPLMQIASRHEVDARIGWAVSHLLEVAVGGRNLLSPPQEQFRPESRIEASRIPWRSFASVTLRF